MPVKAVRKTPEGKAGSPEWLVIHWGYTLLIFGFCGHLGLGGFQHVVYHLHLTTSRRDCRLQYQQDLDQDMFQGFCLSKLLLIHCAACSAKKKMWKVFMFLKFLKRPWKRSYCSELRWKAKALKTLERLKFKGRKKSSAYLCREQSLLCMLGMAPSSGLAPVTFQLYFPLLTSKLNYLAEAVEHFCFRTPKWATLIFFFYIIFKLKHYLEPATSEWTTSHWSS